MSGNGMDHGLLSLAAQHVGVSTAPVAEQYAEALAMDALDGVEIVASRTGKSTMVTSFEDLLKGGPASPLMRPMRR